MRRLALILAAGFLVAAGPHEPVPNEASLRAADAEQMRIIVEGDAKAQEAFMHSHYIINAPANVVRRKEELVADLGRGAMGSERFERTIEGIAITDEVGIVMGSEVVKPTPGSNLGRLHPGETLQRRFTNVFLWEDGRWRFLARQASIVTP
jgi:hypothetical protein